MTHMELVTKIRRFLEQDFRIGPHADDKIEELAETLLQDPAN